MILSVPLLSIILRINHSEFQNSTIGPNLLLKTIFLDADSHLISSYSTKQVVFGAAVLLWSFRRMTLAALGQNILAPDRVGLGPFG